MKNPDVVPIYGKIESKMSEIIDRMNKRDSAIDANPLQGIN
jgi:hypothetical protein